MTLANNTTSMLLKRFSFRLLRHIQQSTRNYTSVCDSSTNASCIKDGLSYPESQSPNHHDLPSFLEYASRIQMDQKSTTFAGTHYEYTVQAALSRLGMSLKRIGGKSDYGIDILGSWPLPSTYEPLRVLVQCKNVAKKLDPSQARELEGAFVGAPLDWKPPGVLAFLVSPKAATKGVRAALHKSRWPVGYVLCTREGRIVQMLWNERARREGMHGIHAGLKYAEGNLKKKEVVLVWKGHSITDHPPSPTAI